MNIIVKEPVNEILTKIDNSSKSCVFLKGIDGSGKTTVINELLKRNKDKLHLVINGSLNYNENIYIKDDKLSNLYFAAILAKKILSVIYSEEFSELFKEYNRIIDETLRRIEMMALTNNYSLKISSSLYENPEIIFEIVNTIKNMVGIEDITVVFDNFDDARNANNSYQQFIYNTLSKYLNVVATISDVEALNDDERLVELIEKAEIIDISYSKDVRVVREVLLDELIRLSDPDDCFSVAPFLFLNNIPLLQDLIIKTNGNLNDMKNMLRVIYRYKEFLTKDDYQAFVLDYLDNEINKNPLISGRVLPKNTLCI